VARGEKKTNAKNRALLATIMAGAPTSAICMSCAHPPALFASHLLLRLRRRGPPAKHPRDWDAPTPSTSMCTVPARISPQASAAGCISILQAVKHAGIQCCGNGLGLTRAHTQRTKDEDGRAITYYEPLVSLDPIIQCPISTAVILKAARVRR
jgi:hypothetical protein